MDDQIKVLLVDDDTLLGGALVMGLCELGMKVHYLSSFIGVDAAIDEFQPNILVFDVEISDKDGITEAENLADRHFDIPIIFISSHTEQYYIERGIMQGHPYVKKPFELVELATYIKRDAKKFDLKLILINKCVLDCKTGYLVNSISRAKVYVPSKERKLLILLWVNLEKTVSRQEILTVLWREQDDAEQMINNAVARLRKLIEIDPALNIITNKRLGYTLCLNDL